MRPSKIPLKSRIAAIARDVYRSLGSGFSEYVYDQAMQAGLRLSGIDYENQKVIELTYKGHSVGEAYPDLVVGRGRRKIVVELKAFGGDIGPAEMQQLKNYMRHLKITRGIIINFQQPEKKEGKTKLEIKDAAL